MAQFQIRFVRIPRWQLFLAGAFIVALLATLFVLAVGAFIVIFPIVLIAGALAYLFAVFRSPARPGRDGDPRTIETEYREIEPERKPIGRDKNR